MTTLGLKPNQEEELEKLSQDFETPFWGPADDSSSVPQDYPLTDTDMDSDEFYQYGLAAAAGADFISRNAVIGYAKPSLIRE